MQQNHQPEDALHCDCFFEKQNSNLRCIATFPKPQDRPHFAQQSPDCKNNRTSNHALHGCLLSKLKSTLRCILTSQIQTHLKRERTLPRNLPNPANTALHCSFPACITHISCNPESKQTFEPHLDPSSAAAFHNPKIQHRFTWRPHKHTFLPSRVVGCRCGSRYI